MGQTYRYSGAANGRPLHQLWFGGPNYRETESGGVAAGIQFDESGLVHTYFENGEEAAFNETLDALWSLAQKTGEPSPESISLNDVDVPLPAGSYYTTIETPLYKDTLVYYYVRSGHSVLSITRNGVESSSLARVDAAAFEATINALGELATAD